MNCQSSSKDLSIVDPANDERNNLKVVQATTTKKTNVNPGPTTTAFYYEYEDFLTIPDYGDSVTTKAPTSQPNPSVLSSASKLTLLTIFNMIAFAVSIFLF